MNARDLEFAEESARLARIEASAGFVAATRDALSRAQAAPPLTAADWLRWHALLCAGTAGPPVGDPRKLGTAVQEANVLLGKPPKPASAPEAVISIAKTILAVVRAAPFSEGNFRLSRLLANVVATRLRMPPIVFRLSDGPAYLASHRSEEALRLYLGGKVREAVYNYEGALFTRVSSDNPWSGVYRGEPPGEGRLIVEWHALYRAEQEWAAAQPVGDA